MIRLYYKVITLYKFLNFENWEHEFSLFYVQPVKDEDKTGSNLYSVYNDVYTFRLN